jgi:hypothetical protein
MVSGRVPRQRGGCGHGHSQTQLSGRFLLVTSRILPPEVGMAQHTTRGDERPLVPAPMTAVERVDRMDEESRMMKADVEDRPVYFREEADVCWSVSQTRRRHGQGRWLGVCGAGGRE